MPLPYSANPTLAYFDFTDADVQVQSANSTASVVSCLDSVSGKAATQLTVASQPTFNNASAINIDGLKNKLPDLKFGGSAYLSFDSVAANVSQSWTVFLVASVVTPAGGEQDLFTFGTSTSAVDGYARLMVTGSAAGFSAHNTAGTGPGTTTGGTVDTKVHLYTLVKDANAGTMYLRLDGTQVATASCTGATAYDRATIGAFNANGAISNQLTGEISEVAVVLGVADIKSVEHYFLFNYGLNTNGNWV